MRWNDAKAVLKDEGPILREVPDSLAVTLTALSDGTPVVARVAHSRLSETLTFAVDVRAAETASPREVLAVSRDLVPGNSVLIEGTPCPVLGELAYVNGALAVRYVTKLADVCADDLRRIVQSLATQARLLRARLCAAAPNAATFA